MQAIHVGAALQPGSVLLGVRSLMAKLCRAAEIALQQCHEPMFSAFTLRGNTNDGIAAQNTI